MVRGTINLPPTLQTSEFSQLSGAIFSLAKDVSLSNLAILLVFRRSFQWCQRIFLSLSMSEVEKKVEGSVVKCESSVDVIKRDFGNQYLE